MKWNEKVINADTISAVERIKGACGETFYLAGGTALALYYGHRVSLDLDCFTFTHKLTNSAREGIIEKLTASGPLEIRTNEDRTCHFIIGTTFVSLFYYPYPLLTPLKHRWRGLPVASVNDISAMKLSAIVGRGSKKDFIDLYFLCKKITLKKVFNAGQRKFPQSGNFLLQAARALVYFDDADVEPMPRMLSKIKWENIKEYFSKEVPKYIRDLS